MCCIRVVAEISINLERDLVSQFILEKLLKNIGILKKIAKLFVYLEAIPHASVCASKIVSNP